jgi:two-component system CheB/CheR fusion protein
MQSRHPNFIVGVGGSAGGLNAYKALLDALPSNTGMALVIISHLIPTANSQLALILSRHTKMKVTVVSSGMPIRANHVYVIPPNADLLIDGFAFKLVTPRTKRNAQVDIFLTSLAAAMGARAIGIILSGYDGDGADGCRQIKATGGITFAQDASAEVDGMPLSAKESGSVDFVLPPSKMADQLRRLASTFKSGRSDGASR